MTSFHSITNGCLEDIFLQISETTQTAFAIFHKLRDLLPSMVRSICPPHLAHLLCMGSISRHVLEWTMFQFVVRLWNAFYADRSLDCSS